MTESKQKSPYWEMGQRIIRARETLTNMSQADMTAALKLKEPTYGNYERGDRRMPPHVLQDFTAITGCLADWIILGKEPMAPEQNEFPPDVTELIEIYTSARKDAQESLLNLARQLPKASE